MAVVEYKMHIVGHRGQFQQPMWIREPGYFYNPDDKTRIGWVVDNAEYYVPDTVNSLTKEELVQRQLGIHANYPERVYIGDAGDETELNIQTNLNVQQEDTDNWRDKTDEEVRAEVEAWYDQYVTNCQGITR